MKNEKGFAVTGILYTILILFLFLILLILNNFGARKVLFDKQKNNVLEKLNEGVSENIKPQEFMYDSGKELQEFITPKDGTYKIEVWGADTDTETGGYVVGNINLYQGIKLFINIGYYSETDDNVTVSSVRTESNNINTIILKTPFGDGADNPGYVFNNTETEDKGISIDHLTETSIVFGSSVSEVKSSKAGTNGYVRISYVNE